MNEMLLVLSLGMGLPRRRGGRWGTQRFWWRDRNAEHSEGI